MQPDVDPERDHSKLNKVGFTSNSRGTEGGADLVAGCSKAALDF